MARQRKEFSSKAAQKKHEAALANRRERLKAKRTLEMASRAAEGQADFAELVEAEKSRIAKSNAGAQSPKVMTQARDNLAQAFDLMGGVPALIVWGRENPTEFYRIWARLIPKEAAESSTALPLETLLEKLATREEQSVGEAAIAIGKETLEAARDAVEREDKISRTLN
jgi:hypothetical protein